MDGQVITKKQAEEWEREAAAFRQAAKINSEKRGEWLSLLATYLGSVALICLSFVVIAATIYSCAQAWAWTLDLGL